MVGRTSRFGAAWAPSTWSRARHIFRRWEQCLTGVVEGVNKRRGGMRALGCGQYDDRGVIPGGALALACAENARIEVLVADDRRGTKKELRTDLAQTA